MNPNPNVVPFERGADFIRQRALKNLRDNNILDALELMRKAVELSPENDDYQLELAQLLCDAGCPEPSVGILLELLERNVKADECLYGLAINLHNVNNMEAAQKLLWKCLHITDNSELRYAAAMHNNAIDTERYLNRASTRKGERLQSMVDEACERMRGEDVPGAVHMFERVLEEDGRRCDVRALLAMAYMLQGRAEVSLAQAERAALDNNADVRTLCVAAQVYNMAGKDAEAHSLIQQAMSGEVYDRRMLILTMYEIGMYEQARAAAQDEISRVPCDKLLLHILAVIAIKMEGDTDEAVRCWKRILWVDPEDTIAEYYIDAAEGNTLNSDMLTCEYQVPRHEMLKRYIEITEKLSGDLFTVGEHWKESERFRRLIGWCLNGGEFHFRDAAVMLLSSIDDDRAERMLRRYFTVSDCGYDILLRAAAMFRLRGQPINRIVPPYVAMEDGVIIPNGDDVLDAMSVGHRQLVRLASDVLSKNYDADAYDNLALMWDMYRAKRGTRMDPLMKTETAAAALAFCYLELKDMKPRMRILARQFGCSCRQLRFFVAHLMNILKKGGAEFGGAD